MTGKDRKSDVVTRSVTADEAELWEHATQSLAPLKGKPRVGSKVPPGATTKTAPKPPTRATEKRLPPPAPKPRPPAAASRNPAPLADLHRRAVRHIAAGKVRIEARLDLHGLRQSEAHEQLRAFLFDASARGLKTVLVITGRGGDGNDADHLAKALGEPQRGVIRRNLPQWLGQADLRTVVLGYAAASNRHGGEGAVYVQLRKLRQS